VGVKYLVKESLSGMHKQTIGEGEAVRRLLAWMAVYSMWYETSSFFRGVFFERGEGC
jgi:hypothetical protein